MSGSSASRREPADVLRLDDRVCAHCGRELAAEFFEFPPALQRKYNKTWEWYYHPCTPECEQKDERREWELMRRDARIVALREKSGLSKRLKRHTFASFKPYVSQVPPGPSRRSRSTSPPGTITARRAAGSTCAAA